MSTSFPDMVIVVPGLIGSVLSKDGIPIWGTSPGALWRVVAGTALATMELKGDDDGRDDLGDGIEATALVSNVEVVPGLWKQGGYSRLAADLIEGLNLEPGRNYFEFAYDWRRDNRVSARKLERFATLMLKRWREESNNAEARIVLVCHSMGGLVARYFVECMDGWKVTRTIVGIGTPFRGSGNALGFLCNGFAWKVGPLTAFDGTSALRSFDSVYQLLPAYPFVDAGEPELARVAALDLPNLDRRRAAAAAAFHEEIRVAQAANAATEAYSRNGTRVRPIVGTDQPTLQSAKLSDPATLTLMASYRGRNYMGDGTVARVSAIPSELADDTATYVPTSHSALQSDPASMNHLRGVLTGSTIDLGVFRAPEGLGSVSLSVDDAYRSGEPVTLIARPSDYVQTLDASIVRCHDSVIFNAMLTPVGTDHVARVDLPPGAYRVTVRGRRLSPVSDVFLVVED